MPMHDDHEGAEVHVVTAIGRSRVGDQVPAVVSVGGLTWPWLVGPESSPPLAIPVEVRAWSDDQRNQVTLFRTPVVGLGCVDQVIRDRSRQDVGAAQRRVLCARRQPRLGEGIRAVVGRVVVAVVAPLSRVAVPPGRLVQRSAFTPLVFVATPALVAVVLVAITTLRSRALALGLEESVNRRTEAETAERSIGAHEPGLEARVGGCRAQALAQEIAMPDPERGRQRSAAPACQLELKTSVAEKRLWRRESRLPLARTEPGKDLLLLPAFQH